MGISNLTSSIRGVSGQEEIYNIRRVQASNLEGDDISVVTATVTNTISVGSIRVGHGPNRVEITPGLGPRLFGNTTVYEDLRIPLTNTRVGGAGKDPSFNKVINNIRAWVFSNGASQNLFFTTQVPHAWKQQGYLEPHVHWMPITTGTGFSQWELEYVVSDQGATMQVEPIRAIGSSAVTGVAFKHYYTEMGDGQTVGSNLNTPSGIIMGRIIYRGDVGDHGADVAGLELDFHYEVDSMGSDEETTKTA